MSARREAKVAPKSHSAASGARRPARSPAHIAPEPPALSAFGRFALPLLLLLAFVFAWRLETSLDLGFHIASGRWILEHRAWPKTDPFTYTLTGRPYIDMHGAFQIVAAWGFGAAGYLGIGVLRTLAVLATLLLMWRRVAPKDGTGAAAALLLLVPSVVAWEMRFIARPELVTYVALAAMLLLIERHRATGDRRWLWACVPVQLAWVYGHALSLFGVFTLGAYAVATTITPQRERGRVRDAWLVLAAAVFVLFLNPYGLEGVRFLWELRSRLQEGNPFGESIGELASPFAAVTEGFVPVLVLRWVLILGAVVALVSVRRLSLFELAIIIGFGLLAATRIRNVGLFVVAATPWLAREVARMWPRNARARQVTLGVAAATVVVMALLATMVAGGSYYAHDQRPARFGVEASAGSYPTRTTERFAREARGPMFNAMDHGGYLLQQLFPRERVYVDGRLEVAGEQFYQNYLDVLSGPGWPRMVERWHPQVAFIPFGYASLIQQLNADSTWRLVDADGAAAMFVAVPGPNAGMPDSLALRYGNPAPSDTAALMPWRRADALAMTFGRRRFPFVPWGRGNALLLTGRYPEARMAYAEAMRAADADEPDIIANYGGVCELLGRRDEAAAWYRRLIAVRRSDPRGRAGLTRLGLPG